MYLLIPAIVHVASNPWNFDLDPLLSQQMDSGGGVPTKDALNVTLVVLFELGPFLSSLASHWINGYPLSTCGAKVPRRNW